MHLSFPPHLLNVFKSRVVCFFIISVIFLGITSADKARNQWSLRHSNPTSDGKFLNVPVYYGDWVPIGSAKAQIESLASSVEVIPNSNRRQDDALEEPVPILASDDLTSPVKTSFVVSDHHSHVSNNQNHYPHWHGQQNHHQHLAEERVEVEHHAPTTFIGPRLPGQQTRDSSVRYSSAKRPSTRTRNQYRGGSGVSGNSRRKHRPTNSDALTRLFGPSFGWNKNRRRDRKIPQPSHSQNSLLGSIFGPSPSSAPLTTTSTGSVALETLGTIGNHWPSFPNIRGSVSNEDNTYVAQEASESVFQPIVKVLPSPDLAQVPNKILNKIVGAILTILI